MNQLLIEITITSLVALLTAAIIFPLLIKVAQRFGWVDKPNHRKIHRQPTPVVGGIGMVVSASLALLLTQSGIGLLHQYPVLAGGIAFINLAIMAFISYRLGAFSLMALLVAMATASVVFLRYNLHPARIFMGDGGSLVLGFLMPAAGILLIEKSNTLPQALPVQEVVAIVAALLALPVFDSLRVYIRRIQCGQSPLKADKTHLHHLILQVGISTGQTTCLLYATQVLFFVIAWVLVQLLSLSAAIAAVAILFVLIAQLLQINGKVQAWAQQIQKMETVQ